MKTLHTASQRGLALVVVLSFLVVLSILLVTSMTVSRLDRSASRNYSQALQAEQLGLGALELITSDLRREMLAGSTTTNVNGQTVLLPRTRASMVPARYGHGTEPNLIRRSLADSTVVLAAYPASDYSTSDLPPVRASAVSSSTNSANARSISVARWNKPALLQDVAQFSAPDWIYVTRSGTQVLSGFDASLAKSSSTNFVVGRFAYAMYDTGGLLDVNVAGYPTSAGNQPSVRVTGGKAFSGYADLLQIPGLSAEIAKNLVDWRNAWSLSNYTNLMASSSAAGGYRSVLGDNTGSDNTFLSRQDLIDYATRNGFPSALRFLGTFSRELNSPSLPAGTDAVLNPAFSTLYRNNKPIQRFNLRNFALLENNPASLAPSDVALIERLFGLTPAADASATHRAWNYRSATIDTPQAAIAAGRDPNVFELVKAAIQNSSLGGNVQNNGLVSELGGGTYSPETNVQHHVARIIANIADQSDADNYPTTIRIGSNEVYGIESLPYFSEIFFKAHFPSNFSGGTGALYTYFELWNPHQGPIPANGPRRVRIRANDDARLAMNYIQIGSPGGPGNPNGSYSRVNSAYPELPPSVPFPSNPITLSNLSAYQGAPRVTDDASDASSRLSALTPVVNGWTVLNVNRAIPATWTGNKFTSLAVSKFVPVLEFEDADGNWHPYTTFAGHFTALGTTGIQEAGRPFMNNFNGGGPSANANSTSVNLSYPKPDPRTFRFRSGVSYSPSYQATMLPGAPSGQALSQDKSGAAPSNPGLLYSNQLAQTVADVDGIVRPADGYLSPTANPMKTGATIEKPILLNRPFRSIAELGYVFRDAPWKSLDFFSNESADSGLLDVFCLEDAEVVAGRTSLNSRNSEVLAAVISGALRDEVSASSTITAADATTIANAVLASSTGLGGPLINRSDLVTALAQPGTVSGAFPAIKTEREAAIRALAPNTQSRTWNVLIDVVAESGRFLPQATALSQFTVEGSRRYWLHLAIDRFTGETVDSFLEVVYE